MLTFLVGTRLAGSTIAGSTVAIALLAVALPYPSRAQGFTEADSAAQETGLISDSGGAHGQGHEAHGQSDHDESDHDESSHGESHHDGPSLEGHDSAAPGEHSHGTLTIPESQPIPAVTLTVHDDALRGWNLEVEVENFTLAPEAVNQASNTTEGHAHLYVNGVKITRLYGPWFYLESLPSGEQELRVELNANGHEVLTHNGEAIADTVVVTVP